MATASWSASKGDTVTGINRRGLVVAIPDPIREAVEHIPFDVLIDGEAVGAPHAFDLLDVKGNDLRHGRYLDPRRPGKHRAAVKTSQALWRLSFPISS